MKLEKLNYDAFNYLNGITSDLEFIDLCRIGDQPIIYFLKSNEEIYIIRVLQDRMIINKKILIQELLVSKLDEKTFKHVTENNQLNYKIDIDYDKTYRVGKINEKIYKMKTTSFNILNPVYISESTDLFILN